MNTGAQRSALKETGGQRGIGPNGETRPARSHEQLASDGSRTAAKIRVFIAAENRLLRDALAKILAKQENIQVSGLDSMAPFPEEGFRELDAEIFLFASRGKLDDDVAAIRAVRAAAPQTRILVMGMGPDAGEFLQCVRAGVSGYFFSVASSAEVLRGIRAVQAGAAACSVNFSNVAVTET